MNARDGSYGARCPVAGRRWRWRCPCDLRGVVMCLLLVASRPQTCATVQNRAVCRHRTGCFCTLAGAGVHSRGAGVHSRGRGRGRALSRARACTLAAGVGVGAHSGCAEGRAAAGEASSLRPRRLSRCAVYGRPSSRAAFAPASRSHLVGSASEASVEPASSVREAVQASVSAVTCPAITPTVAPVVRASEST